MVAVVAFSGDALRQPVVAWTSVAAGLVLATLSTWWLRTAPGRLMTPAFVLTEGAYALVLTVIDGWVFEPGHVFVTSQNLASQWPLVAAISIGVALGPIAGAAFGLLVGPARWIGADLNDFGLTLARDRGDDDRRLRRTTARRARLVDVARRRRHRSHRPRRARRARRRRRPDTDRLAPAAKHMALNVNPARPPAPSAVLAGSGRCGHRWRCAGTWRGDPRRGDRSPAASPG